MAPPSADSPVAHHVREEPEALQTTINSEPSSLLSKHYPTPLVYSGSLDQYESFDLTTVIGKEFPTVQLTELLKDDSKIKDLAITVSQRGVVFFRNQDINIEEQKTLAQKLGELSGKPETSKLHKHAVSNSKRGIPVDDKGTLDDEVSIVSSDTPRESDGNKFADRAPRKTANHVWHSDITFENIPSDYALLKVVSLPGKVGGDTLFASGYDAYDRLSPSWQDFLEGLTATHFQPSFNKIVAEKGIELIEENRGTPENTGTHFQAVHPVIRTNPVTGWKSIFGGGQQVEHGWINNVTDRESELIKGYLLETIASNYDLQVRIKWNQNDLAIWDNRSVFHTDIGDYKEKRVAHRVLSLGERPYLDKNSSSRREALGGL
ncbi:putative alpha-ketoglutarate-dependent sulfonate dioxygenase [Lachnellula hyalina]|uniref:Putative alpha-ketoglutarate-dependent sulfonate dioxygenase n=1 Tax=Lachnellula hyalina TaxID=1316788 RepID=A0A8H8R576_9HELO|nr:putative alpha-ketoglutarate-dependent sulfonate dioxygenase [Lachnellula hyalina]TVY27079.1 putative alpha-ketoglutarate-dependent sulfonate dioxygenase [Lachnellula hyalina]